jgi:hypothetical protein
MKRVSGVTATHDPLRWGDLETTQEDFVLMKVIALPAIWIVVTVAAFGLLRRYSAVPGAVGATPVRIPDRAEGGGGARQAGYRLMVFLHPRCPCSRATVRMLERVLAQCDGSALAVEAVLVRPAGVDPRDAEKWTRGGMWEAAGAIPGVRTVLDDGGVRASRYGARTSGHVVLYDGSGRLVFSGGITPSRGHEGESAGVDAVLAAVRGAPRAWGAAAVHTPVFGCDLGNGAAVGAAAVSERLIFRGLSDDGDVGER